MDFDTADSCDDDDVADSDIEVEDLPGEGEQMWNRRKRRTWKERYADSDVGLGHESRIFECVRTS